jgi:hypothetical protein
VGRSVWILVEASETTGWVNGAFLACPAARGGATDP